MVERNFGGTVELAKPVVRSQKQAAGFPVLDLVPAPVASAPEPPPAVTPPPPPQERRATAEASIRILDGVNAGVIVPLHKAQTTIGRPGLQVAALVNEQGSFSLKPVEGSRAPTVNGQPVEAGGRVLAPGDIIELAGTRIEFLGGNDSGLTAQLPSSDTAARI
jgi:hypothetical protein